MQESIGGSSEIIDLFDVKNDIFIDIAVSRLESIVIEEIYNVFLRHEKHKSEENWDIFRMKLAYYNLKWKNPCQRIKRLRQTDI